MTKKAMAVLLLFAVQTTAEDKRVFKCGGVKYESMHAHGFSTAHRIAMTRCFGRIEMTHGWRLGKAPGTSAELVRALAKATRKAHWHESTDWQRGYAAGRIAARKTCDDEKRISKKD